MLGQYGHANLMCHLMCAHTRWCGLVLRICHMCATFLLGVRSRSLQARGG